MALFITIDLNPTPTQTGGDDCFQPAVIGVVRVVRVTGSTSKRRAQGE